MKNIFALWLHHSCTEYELAGIFSTQRGAEIGGKKLCDHLKLDIVEDAYGLLSGYSVTEIEVQDEPTTKSKGSRSKQKARRSNSGTRRPKVSNRKTK